MKALKVAVLVFFAAWLILPLVSRMSNVSAQDKTEAPGQAPGSIDSDPDNSRFVCLPVEAVTGFDDSSININFVPDQKHHDDNITFDAIDGITDGLGPIYNAQSCRECHQNTVSGSISQITELRAGITEYGIFSNPCVSITDDAGQTHLICDRSLINDRAICPAGPLQFTLINGQPFNHPLAQAQERIDNLLDGNGKEVKEENIVTTFRTSLNTLGDGLVESVNSNKLQAIASGQPVAQRGTLILVPLLEVPDPTFRVGRFGWKNQHASLLSFSGDAYLNEMGITNRLLPDEFTEVCDEIKDNEDDENDIDAFARFMRATKAPSRGIITDEVKKGDELFNKIGCAVCHVPEIVTDPVGTLINGGTFKIPQGLGCRKFHPYGDFLLHDIGTGDGIVQVKDVNGNLIQSTANQMRTAPLWGVRLRDRLMHDGESLTFVSAIRRHHNQGQSARDAFFNSLNPTEQNQVIAFLKSL
ncbi:MAG: di-heme oxidoredictase family protein [Pyrinomonadaceae bacterium]